jgi:hypothetical protein
VICREVIKQLEVAQEIRELSMDEVQLKKCLKHRVLVLAAIGKSRARQKSRLVWLKKGDANTKYFHIMANLRKKKNQIVLLRNDTEVASSQKDKLRITFDHFQKHIGTCPPRNLHINFEEIQWQLRNLLHLELPFIEQEIANIVKAILNEKSPGPDGFIGLFFKECWEIIKVEILAAVDQFFNLNQQGLQFLNQALVVLLLKKPNAEGISDFRPISLIHSFAKLISKMMANRLAPELGNLVSCTQNAFIKKRSIHDNFMHVQQTIKELHKKKVLALFIKLDISKAFDTVNWSYMLDIMTFLGFGPRWRGWVSAIWATTSSSFMMNGEQGKRIRHKRGVR